MKILVENSTYKGTPGSHPESACIWQNQRMRSGIAGSKGHCKKVDFRNTNRNDKKGAPAWCSSQILRAASTSLTSNQNNRLPQFYPLLQSWWRWCKLYRGSLTASPSRKVIQSSTLERETFYPHFTRLNMIIFTTHYDILWQTRLWPIHCKDFRIARRCSENIFHDLYLA